MPFDQWFFRCRFVQGKAQLAVGEHPAQRALVRFRPEVQPTGFHLVQDGNGCDVAPMRFKDFLKPEMTKKTPTGGGNRGCATVETFCGQARRIGPIDKMAGQPFFRSGHRQCHAHQAAAQDQQVSLVCHRVCP